MGCLPPDLFVYEDVSLWSLTTLEEGNRGRVDDGWTPFS